MSDSIKFEIEWLDGGEFVDEVHQTFARLVLSVAGAAVTRIRDATTRSDRDGIYVSVYPLAEWLVQNWFSLRYEGENQWRDRRSFERRHRLPMMLDGFLFPDLMILAEGDRVGLEWNPRPIPERGLDFIGHGTFGCQRMEFDDFGRRLVEAVLTRLGDGGIQDTPLAREWSAIQSMNEPEHRFAVAAARLGADAFDTTDLECKRIGFVSANFPADLQAEILSLATPRDFDRQVTWFTNAIGSLERRDGSTGLRDLKQDLRELIRPIEDGLPYERGAAAAARLRTCLGLGLEPIDGLAGLRRILHVEESEAILFSPDQVEKRIDALCHLDDDSRPSFYLTKLREDGRMFSLGRSAYDFLRYDDRSWNVVTDLKRPADQESRAFAAHFLCPPEAIAHSIAKRSVAVINDDDIQEIAERYRVSTYIVHHHVTNYAIAEMAI